MVHFPGFMSLQYNGGIDNLIANTEQGGDGYAGGGHKGRSTQT